MTESVHPGLEAVARAICEANPEVGVGTDWADWLPEARAALRALADWDPTGCGSHIDPEWLREIAADPKPTVEDLLTAHLTITYEEPAYVCECGDRSGDHAKHQADMLREAGLVKEES